MNDVELTHLGDFLSIALEEMEHENYDSAQQFVEDAYSIILEEIDE